MFLSSTFPARTVGGVTIPRTVEQAETGAGASLGSGEVAKRFTETTKWSREWFQELKPKHKLFWLFICDNCDHAGVWGENYRLASFIIGEEFTAEEILAAFGGRIVRIDSDKLFVPSFIEFQYGKLSRESKPHQSVIKQLEKHKINPENLTLSEGYTKGIHTLKEKEKDKEKEKGGVGEKEPTPIFDLEAAYRRYPRKEGKSRGLKKLKSEIKTVADYESLIVAIENYAQSRRGQDPTFTKHFSTFAAEWRDWIEVQPKREEKILTLEEVKALA